MKELVLDVSHNDAGIDIPQWVEQHGVWAVIVKAGGYEVLDTDKGCPEQFENSWYKRHADAVTAAGVHLGAYYYTVAQDVVTARANADHFAELLGKYGHRFDMPVYADIEDERQLAIGVSLLTNVVLTFIRRMEEHGYRCGLYTGRCALHECMDGWAFEPYPLWIAEYSDRCRTDVPHGMWQFGSMRLSDGDVSWYDPEGYVDANWCYIDYPAKSGKAPKEEGTVGRLISYQDMIAEAAEHYANHDAHGYSQPNREGDGTIEELRYSDGTPMRIRGGDKDCSEMARACAAAAGLVPWDYWESYMWTENEDEVLTSHGFVRLPFDWHDTRRGDILWVKGHTGVALGDGLQADAHGDEYGGIDGTNQGDQTGHEIEVRDLQWYWTWTYRYVGPERPQPKPKPMPEQHPGDKKNNVGIHYRAHCQRAGWLPAVRDGQTAGTEGYSARMEAIKISPPEGVTLDVMAHLQGIGDVWYQGVRAGERSGTESSDIDPIIGTVGESRRIEGIEVDVVDWPRELAGMWLYYQLHLQGVGWTDPVRAGEYCGTRGESRRAEAVRMWVA